MVINLILISKVSRASNGQDEQRIWRMRETRTQSTPFCPTTPHGQFRPCRVRPFQERYHNHRRRQNDAGTGNGSRWNVSKGYTWI